MDSFDGIFEFVAVAETGGFSSAAKLLGCSTSHVSRQLSRLEQRLGCTLLARTTRQINLTDHGTFYYHQCKQLVTGLQQANEQLNQQQFDLTGVLRVSAAGGFAEQHLAPALMMFAKQHPNLSIEINFDSRFVNFVEDGVDFAIRYGDLKDSSLIARKLVSRSMMLAASPSYLKQHGTPTHPDQLKSHNCLVTNNGQWVFTIDGLEQNFKVPARWKSNNANVIVQACKEGLGIAYLPTSTFKKCLKDHTVIPLLQEYCKQDATSWIVYQKKQFMPLKARIAIDFLTDYFADWS